MYKLQLKKKNWNKLIIWAERMVCSISYPLIPAEDNFLKGFKLELFSSLEIQTLSKLSFDNDSNSYVHPWNVAESKRFYESILHNGGFP